MVTIWPLHGCMQTYIYSIRIWCKVHSNGKDCAYMMELVLLHQLKENHSAYSRLYSIIEPVVHWFMLVCVCVYLYVLICMVAASCCCLLHIQCYLNGRMLFCANICRCVNVCAESALNGSSILIVQIHMQHYGKSTERPPKQQQNRLRKRNKKHSH